MCNGVAGIFVEQVQVAGINSDRNILSLAELCMVVLYQYQCAIGKASGDMCLITQPLIGNDRCPRPIVYPTYGIGPDPDNQFAGLL